MPAPVQRVHCACGQSWGRRHAMLRVAEQVRGICQLVQRVCRAGAFKADVTPHISALGTARLKPACLRLLSPWQVSCFYAAGLEAGRAVGEPAKSGDMGQSRGCRGSHDGSGMSFWQAKADLTGLQPRLLAARGDLGLCRPVMMLRPATLLLWPNGSEGRSSRPCLFLPCSHDVSARHQRALRATAA